ncbi:MAG: BamA/TamA family outer membrane protein [Calditrichia bacterium]
MFRRLNCSFFIICHLFIFVSVYGQYKLEFEGNKFFSDRILGHEILFLTYPTATEGDLAKAMQILQNYYEDNGFLLSEVRYKLSGKGNIKDTVLFNITEGQRFYLGKVRITGLKYNRQEFVRKFIDFEANMPLSREVILNMQKELDNSALFDSIRFSVDKFDFKTRRVDLLLNVWERKPFFLGSGIGFDSEDGLKFIGETGGRHLRGNGQSARLEGSCSFYYASHVMLKHLLIQGKYYFPLLMSRNLQLENEMFYESDKPSYVSFHFKKAALESNLRFFIYKNLSWNMGAILSKVWLSSALDENRLNGAIQSKVDQNRQIHFRLTFASVFPAINPVNGMRADLLYEYNGGFLGGANDFHRISTSTSWYFPLGLKNVFAFHLEGGWAESLSAGKPVPEYERFFLGGAQNLRGYRNNKLGPKNEYGRYIGGLAMLYYSFEFRHMWSSHWQFVWFLDNGELKGNFYKITLRSIILTTGPGIRYRWHGNLFSFDLGIKISEFEWNDPGWISFGYGQHF